jgi:hypothetical protein
METATNIAISDRTTNQEKLVVDDCCDTGIQQLPWHHRMSQHEKHKRKNIDSMTEEADGDEIEDHILASLSRSIKHPKEHPREHDPTSHTGGSRSLTGEHDQTTEEVEPPPVESFPRKRLKYQRRNSFVVRLQHRQSPSIFGNESFHQTSPDRFLSPKPQKVVHEEPTPSTHTKDSWDDLAWGNASWSNTDDTKWYNLTRMSCDSKPIIPQPLKRLPPGNDEDEIMKRPDATLTSTLISSLALVGLDEKDHYIPDPLDDVEVSPRTPRLFGLSKRAAQNSP